VNNRRDFIKKVSALGLLTGLPSGMMAAPSIADPELTWHASGNGGIVASGPKPSARAGIDILDKGGNAVDASVAVIFNLAISDYGNFCIGGEVPFMCYNAKDGKVNVFNGMGGAPKDKKAIKWYYENGIPSRRGIKASTTPSAVSTCLAALEHNGSMSFEQVIAPTLSLLDAGGKTWYANLATTLRKMVDTEKHTEGTRATKIRAARDRFYKGDIADELDNYYVSTGGFLRKADLQAHTTLIEEAASVTYRGYHVYKCGTWTQGPVLLQALKLLENFDLKKMGFFSVNYIHVVAEAMKLAFADRDRYYGDPAFVKVPLKQLLSDEYAAIRWPLIEMNYASQIIRPGDPVRMRADIGPGEYWPGEHGTTTCVVVDKWGNMVAATPSANPEYSVCETLGIAHNTRLSSLNTQKQHPNSLQPGKRPRITLTPTLVLKDGKPVLGMSINGGDVQEQVSLELLLNFVEFGMMPKEAVSAPRFRTYHFENSFNPSYNPHGRILRIGGLTVNTENQSTIENLVTRGHSVDAVKGTMGIPVMVYVDQKTGTSYAAGEPERRFCAALSTL
jgi:gamma-glutamyltranspeptidase / glutathione hydrolase